VGGGGSGGRGEAGTTGKITVFSHPFAHCDAVLLHFRNKISHYAIHG
jgi:hypothetical protein